MSNPNGELARLKQAYWRSKITISQWSRAAKVRRATIYSVLYDQHSPTMRTVEKLSLGLMRALKRTA